MGERKSRMKLNAVSVGRHFKDIEKINCLTDEAFPPEERMKPSDMIQMKKDGLDFWALYDGECFVGYVAVMQYADLAYIFYLAIEPALRSKGYGSAALSLLRQLYAHLHLVVDIEKQNETAGNHAQRQKRRNFYMQNGYYATGHDITYGGVMYEIFSLDKGFQPKRFYQMFREFQARDTSHFEFIMQ